jgi:hypothetical protein
MTPSPWSIQIDKVPQPLKRIKPSAIQTAPMEKDGVVTPANRVSKREVLGWNIDEDA